MANTQGSQPRQQTNARTPQSQLHRQSRHPEQQPPVGLLSLPGSIDALKDVAFGSIAGIIGKVIEYPFDTVKVRLQSQPDHVPLRYAGPVDCFYQSWVEEGIVGLYRGVSAPLIGAAIETSSLFFSYNLAQHFLCQTLYPAFAPNDLPLSALLVSGAVSGAFTSLLLTPIELVKCKMQVPVIARDIASANAPGSLPPVVPRPPTALGIVRDVWRYRGILGFWHGQLGTLIRETGGSAAWFGSYEGVKKLLERRDHASKPKSSASLGQETQTPLPVPQRLFAGAIAGMSYNFLFYPADTVKSRMQTEEVQRSGTGSAGGFQRPGRFWAVGRDVWRQHGIAGLYRGCGITVGRAAPSSAVIFTVYEALRGWAG